MAHLWACRQLEKPKKKKQKVFCSFAIKIYLGEAEGAREKRAKEKEQERRKS